MKRSNLIGTFAEEETKAMKATKATKATSKNSTKNFEVVNGKKYWTDEAFDRNVDALFGRFRHVADGKDIGVVIYAALALVKDMVEMLKNGKFDALKNGKFDADDTTLIDAHLAGIKGVLFPPTFKLPPLTAEEEQEEIAQETKDEAEIDALDDAITKLIQGHDDDNIVQALQRSLQDELSFVMGLGECGSDPEWQTIRRLITQAVGIAYCGVNHAS